MKTFIPIILTCSYSSQKMYEQSPQLLSLIAYIVLFSFSLLSGASVYADEIISEIPESGIGYIVDFSDDGTRLLVGGRDRTDGANGNPGNTTRVFSISKESFPLTISSADNFTVVENTMAIGQVIAIDHDEIAQLGNTIPDFDGNGYGSSPLASISGDGSTIAIHKSSSINNDVEIYRLTNSTWDLNAVIELSDSSGNATMDLDYDGDTIVIGCPRCSLTGPSGNGYTKVYRKSGGTWSILGEAFGLSGIRSVSITDDGNKVALGADSPSHIGEVGIYEYTPGSTESTKWLAIGEGGILGEVGGDQNGYIVSLSDDGTRIATSSPFGGTGNTPDKRGEVRVFDLIDEAWEQSGVFSPHSFTAGANESSMSLSRDGTTVALASEGGNGESACSYPGRVRIYRYNTTSSSWGALGNSIDGQLPNDLFSCVHTRAEEAGWSLSLSKNGNSIAIGGPGFDPTPDYVDDGVRWGRVRVFNYNGSDWALGGTLTYSISGEDSSSVSINSSTGILTFNNAPDYASKNTYYVTVSVANGNTSVSQNITINITEEEPQTCANQSLDPNQGCVEIDTVSYPDGAIFSEVNPVVLTKGNFQGGFYWNFMSSNKAIAISVAAPTGYRLGKVGTSADQLEAPSDFGTDCLTSITKPSFDFVGDQKTTNTGEKYLDAGVITLHDKTNNFVGLCSNDGCTPSAPRIKSCEVFMHLTALDSDGDGVSDPEEIAQGTNPNNYDTDYDGLWDGVDPFPLDLDNDGDPDSTDPDDDSDGVNDNVDPYPHDTDNDGTPNVTDYNDDGDSLPDSQDAFPLDPNEQYDTDGDGIGNNADTDDDGDGVLDDNDFAPFNPLETTDTDSDGVGNNSDNCSTVANADQTDTDSDGQGNVCDTDDDGDGTNDTDDAFPLDATETVDTDGDGIGNNADTDDDGDGVLDTDDDLPLDATETIDTDGDGIGNNTDPDDDNDGVLDEDDEFPLYVTIPPSLIFNVIEPYYSNFALYEGTNGTDIQSWEYDSTLLGNNYTDKRTYEDKFATISCGNFSPVFIDYNFALKFDQIWLAKNGNDEVRISTLDFNDKSVLVSGGYGDDWIFSKNSKMNLVIHGGYGSNDLITIETNNNGDSKERILSMDEIQTIGFYQVDEGDSCGSLSVYKIVLEDQIIFLASTEFIVLRENSLLENSGIKKTLLRNASGGGTYSFKGAYIWDLFNLFSSDNDSDQSPDFIDTDDDGDGTLDTNDAFPLDATETVDTDGDGTGNNADTDDDGDGVLDTNDAFPLDATETVDTDSDGVGDSGDNCSLVVNADQTDTDADNLGNVCDSDDDNDGLIDDYDAFPLDATEQVDSDSDGTGNNADTDDDGDGTNDTNDAFPLDSTETVDTDGDGTGNNADTDDDGDGVLDTNDAFPLDATEQVDSDLDSVGDNADTDDDNDGTPDVNDPYPLIAPPTLTFTYAGDTDKPLAGITLTQTESGGTATTRTSNANGQVTLSATTANPYTLSASFTDTGEDPVDLLDAIWILQHSGELRTLTASQLLAADASGDGDVDLLDAIYILQHSGELRVLSPSLVFLDAATSEALSETTFSPTDTPSITVIRMGDVDQSFDPG